MNYYKVKKILIAIFILLNLALLFFNVFKASDNYVSRSVIRETEKLFAKNNIILEIDIPRTKKEFEQMEIGDIVIDKKYKDVDEHRIVEELKSFSEGKLDKRKFVEFYETDDEIIFVEQVKDKLIYINKIIYNKNQRYADIIIYKVKMQELTKRALLPAHVILINSYLDSSAKRIDGIKLIYVKYEENVLGPAWWIKTDNKVNAYYAYKAYDGTEIILN